MRWGVLFLGLAACGSGTGIDLEIRSDDVAITSVEVFIGNDFCYESNNQLCVGGVAWEAGMPRPGGTTYVMTTEQPGTIEARISPELDGSSYVVRLTAAGDYAETKMLAIVGFDGDRAVAVAKMGGVHIPENTAEHWIVNLVPAPQAEVAPPRPAESEAGMRVHVWGREGLTTEQVEGARCAVVQEWDGNNWNNYFVVPNSDRDCDGELPELECDPRYFNLHNEPGLPQNVMTPCLESAEATTVSSLPNLAGACMIGHTSCRDGSVPDPTCGLEATTTRYTCVPDELCELCGGPYGLASCVSETSFATSGISHADCELKAATGTGAICGLTSGFAAQVVLPFPCMYFEIADVDALQTDLLRPFPIDQAQVDVQIVETNPMCQLNVYFKSGIATLDSRHWYVLKIHPYYDDRTLLVPLRIEFTASDCTSDQQAPTPCEVAGIAEDNLVRCAGLTPL